MSASLGGGIGFMHKKMLIRNLATLHICVGNQALEKVCIVCSFLTETGKVNLNKQVVLQVILDQQIKAWEAVQCAAKFFMRVTLNMFLT